MDERFDVVIVGARCAGSPLATLLGRQDVRVALVDQDAFPSDALSTHFFEADALAFLARLGVDDQLRATRAPFITRTDNRLEDIRWSTDWPQVEGDIGGLASVRRIVLDQLLVEAAQEAGAELYAGSGVTDLVRDQTNRVAGVRLNTSAGERELSARLVIGADGRTSTVARLAGARQYNLTPNQRATYWSYFEGAAIGEPTFVFHRWADRFVVAAPCDSGLYEVQVMPDLADLDAFRGDVSGSFMAHAMSCEPVAEAIASATRVGKVLGMVRWSGFFREPAGRGWVLVGDAGLFKDPAAGRGIGDAFEQAESLAATIVGALRGSDAELDTTLKHWGRRRDEAFAEYYWFGTDLGAGGRVPVVLPELVRGLQAGGKSHLMLEIQSRRARPSRVLSPPRVVAAVARALLRRGGERGRLLRELAQLGSQQARRVWLKHRPAFATDD